MRALAEVQLCQERLERLVRIDEALAPDRGLGVWLRALQIPQRNPYSAL